MSSSATVHVLPDGDAAAPRQAIGQFTVAMQITQQRSITMIGTVYSDDDKAAVNERIDSFQDALDRQFIRADIVTKKAQIKGETLNLEVMRKHYDAMVEKKNTRKGLTSQEINAVQNYDQTVKASTERIESLRAAIIEAERQLKA